MRFIIFVICIVLFLASVVLGGGPAPCTRNRFVGKSVIVTGGTSGIGNSTAFAFACEGARVVIAALNDTRGSIIENQLNSMPQVIKAGGRVTYYHADVRKQADVRNLIQATAKLNGGVDIAINNAGIGGYLGNTGTIPSSILHSEHDPILNNLYGVLNCMQEEIAYWLSVNRPGVIVNTASANGLGGCRGCSMYAASKWGIIGMTKSVALEYIDWENPKVPRIRVNAVAPGLINTPLTWNQAKFLLYGQQPWEPPYIDSDQDPLWLKVKDGWISELPGKKIGDPMDIAMAILYLSSDDAAYITGSVLSVDDGITSL